MPVTGREVREGGERGFVLLEVVIAAAILSVAVAIVLQSTSVAMRAERVHSDLSLANLLADRALWEIRKDEFPPPGTTSGRFPKPYEKFGWETEVKIVSRREVDRAEDLEAVVLSDLRKVTVTIIWGEGDQERKWPITVYMARRERTPREVMYGIY